jgi:hypothetical protein
VCAALYQLYRIITLKPGQGFRVKINTDVTQGSGLALHNRASAQVRLNIGIMRRHHGDDCLTQTRCCLRSKITHCYESCLFSRFSSIAFVFYVVKKNRKYFSQGGCGWFCPAASSGDRSGKCRDSVEEGLFLITPVTCALLGLPGLH